MHTVKHAKPGPLASTVFLTATISPPAAMLAVHRADPAVRRADYRTSVMRYSKLLRPEHTQLMLIENSGADLSDLVDIARKFGHQLKVISYVENEMVSARGKGASEARMFDMIDSSSLSSGPVVKVTGRLFVKNVDQLLAGFGANTVSCLVRRDLSWVDTRLIISDSSVWERRFQGMAAEVDEREGYDLERVFLRRLVAATTTDRAHYAPFSREPIVLGVSGSYGARYNNLRARMLRPLKNIAKQAPSGVFI